MATLILEVPEDIERDFNAAVPEEERQPLFVEMMARAARERRAELTASRAEAAQKLRELRVRDPRYSSQEIARVRRELRD